ncbi:MAG: TatD family hydrolase [Deltaproteobacteria bacterium]|nr:TatD family hydrolase [Deltaproteobacteria bacterium]
MQSRDTAPAAGIVDTHCHLTIAPLSADVDGVLARASEAGVTRVVAAAYDTASWDPLAALSGRNGVFVAFGLHPWVSSEELDLGRLERLLRGHNAVAVGEIGLDFKIEGCDRERQVRAFESQLDVAAALGLPVLLHCRSAFEEMLAILKRRPAPVKGVVHAFSRGPELMRRFLALGLHVAFGGAITRPGADRARSSAAAAPVDRVLVETDAPSIGLEGVEANDVEPRHAAFVVRALASLRGLSFEDAALLTTANARRLFGLS